MDHRISSFYRVRSVLIGQVIENWDTFLIGSEFFNHNHEYCVAETGYQGDKVGPSAPDREYTMLGS